MNDSTLISIGGWKFRSRKKPEESVDEIKELEMTDKKINDQHEMLFRHCNVSIGSSGENVRAKVTFLTQFWRVSTISLEFYPDLTNFLHSWRDLNSTQYWVLFYST